MSRDAPKPAVESFPKSTRVAIVAARFNEHIVGELLRGCLGRLAEMELADKRIQVEYVPGAFELPLAAKLLARTKRFDAIICLGCVIRGETPHFEYVAGECARGIQQVGLETGIPVIFGVLTTNTSEQAMDRTGGKHGHAGRRAAEAAAEMVALSRRAGKKK